MTETTYSIADARNQFAAIVHMMPKIQTILCK